MQKKRALFPGSIVLPWQGSCKAGGFSGTWFLTTHHALSTQLLPDPRLPSAQLLQRHQLLWHLVSAANGSQKPPVAKSFHLKSPLGKQTPYEPPSLAYLRVDFQQILPAQHNNFLAIQRTTAMPSSVRSGSQP